MTSAATLNETCACIQPDPERLRASFPADGEASYAAVAARAPTLFAALPVFVEPADLAAIDEAVGALHRAALAAPPATDAVDPARDGAGVLMGYDFHLTDAGPRLIEVNTNAGGALLAARVVEATGRPGFAEAVEERLFAAFVREHAARTPAPLRRVAIVDERPTEQFLYPEFLLYARMLARRGIDAVVADPGALTFDGGALRHAGEPVDFVYLRSTDFTLTTPGSAAIRAAWDAGVVTVSPNPRHHATFAHKARLCTWSTPGPIAGLAESDRAVVQRVVPRTVRVTADDADRLWADRSAWFFKPVAGFGSRAAYRGDKLTRGKWAEILSVPDGYVAQALVPPSTRRLLPSDTTLKVDLRAIAYDGEVQLVFARLYQGQTTNLRTPGGGFAAVLPTPPTCA
jgi:hypothetical protein